MISEHERSILIAFSHNAGPKANPADLTFKESASVQDQFAQIFLAATETAGSTRPVRFLSRFDKSAANIRESSLWAAIGQVPWAHPHATWYHQYQDSPLGALEAASALNQYTLTERGTWFALNDAARDRLEVFVSSPIFCSLSHRNIKILATIC
jgi:ABC-type tungstate transport system permease subunit